MDKGRRKERDDFRVRLRPPLEKMGFCRGRDFDEQYKLSISKNKQTNKKATRLSRGGERMKFTRR